jgi:hypothetical protein
MIMMNYFFIPNYMGLTSFTSHWINIKLEIETN